MRACPWVLPVLCLVFCLPGALAADRILLKNGETVAGRFLGEEEDGILVQTADGATRRLPSSSIEEVKLGLIGVKLCFESHVRRSCEDQFRAVRRGSLVVVRGPEYESESEIPMASVTRLEIWPQGRGNVTADIDVVSAKGEITLTSGQHFTGRVERAADGFVVNGNGGKVLVDGRLIDHMKLDFTPERNIRARDFLPGLKRYEQGDRWRGGLQAMAFTAALGLSAYSAYGLSTAAAEGKSDPTTWLFYNTSHRAAFTNQMRLFRASAWTAGGLFCLNALDILLGAQAGQKTGLAGVDFRMIPGPHLDRRASVAFRWSF